MLEYVPSGQVYLSRIVRAMGQDVTLKKTYQSFLCDCEEYIEVEPWGMELLCRSYCRWCNSGGVKTSENQKYMADIIKGMAKR